MGQIFLLVSFWGLVFHLWRVLEEWEAARAFAGAWFAMVWVVAIFSLGQAFFIAGNCLLLIGLAIAVRYYA